MCKATLYGDEIDIHFVGFKVSKSSQEHSRPTLEVCSSTHFGGNLQIIPRTGESILSLAGILAQLPGPFSTLT